MIWHTLWFVCSTLDKQLGSEVYKFSFSLWCSQGIPGGRAAHPEDQLRRTMRNDWGKVGENDRRMRKNEKMFLSSPPNVESLATPLLSVISKYCKWISVPCSIFKQVLANCVTLCHSFLFKLDHEVIDFFHYIPHTIPGDTSTRAQSVASSYRL